MIFHCGFRIGNEINHIEFVITIKSVRSERNSRRTLYYIIRLKEHGGFTTVLYCILLRFYKRIKKHHAILILPPFSNIKIIGRDTNICNGIYFVRLEMSGMKFHIELTLISKEFRSEKFFFFQKKKKKTTLNRRFCKI